MGGGREKSRLPRVFDNWMVVSEERCHGPAVISESSGERAPNTAPRRIQSKTMPSSSDVSGFLPEGGIASSSSAGNRISCPSKLPKGSPGTMAVSPPSPPRRASSG